MIDFKSPRLIYRAVEESDKSYIHLLLSDTKASANGRSRLHKPIKKADSEKFTAFLANEALLGVLICIPKDVRNERLPPRPIGRLTLKTQQGQEHHRKAMISLQIEDGFQGKGYGSEAILWALEWAFVNAGLHRVKIGCFSYNEGALKLYERLGFVLESTEREGAWFAGGWHDILDLGMLEGEWRERYGVKEEGRIGE
jgi:RimJ/RimL family protein N-acetyltransferase